MEYRTEHDSLGEVAVPADRYWGAQTQRSFENFKIGIEKMPKEIIHAFGILKLAAARTNLELVPQRMTQEKCRYISEAANEVISGALSEHFPLAVWQTGSGTQSNMNVNEVIANRGNELAGKRLLHPNDDVNMSQSSNDTFPTAMHIAAVLETEKTLLPAIKTLADTLARLESENAGIVKSGRTHLEDATPITFGQEISGWRASLEKDAELIRLSEKRNRFLHCAEQVPCAVVKRRACVCAWCAEGSCMRPHEDSKRHPLACKRSEVRTRGDNHPRKRAGFFDNAGQGQPHAV